MCEMVAMGDVYPQWQDQEEAQTDEWSNPVVCTFNSEL